MKFRFLLLLLAIPFFVFNCSDKENEEPKPKTEFSATEDFTNEGYAGQKVVLTIKRSNTNEAYPVKGDLEVFFGTQPATINLITPSQSGATVDVTVPAGYVNETVDINIKTKNTSINIMLEDAFTYKTPQITEAPQHVLFDSAFQIKMINRPADFKSFSLQRTTDGNTYSLTFIKSEGDYVWVKFPAHYSMLKYDAYRVVGYINELVTAKSGELSFASSYEFLSVSNGTPETLVIRVNNIISHVPPVVKMDGTTLTYRLTWHETDYIYDHYYAIPINTQVGEHTLTVNGEANALYLPLKGNTFTYKGGGPGIVTFNDIKLGAVNGQESTGSVFSSIFGTIYKTSQIPPYAAHNIDIAYVGINGMQFFEAPSKVQEWGLTAIPNPTETYFINYIESSGITFTPTMFDNMTDDTLLRSLVINADNESFPSGSGAVPRIVLFVNSAGKKGVIKIKEVVGGVNGYVIFDVKVQE